ncbi:unnamed protein product, partial [Ectocarpus sp. 4 AP-2014]
PYLAVRCCRNPPPFPSTSFVEDEKEEEEEEEEVSQGLGEYGTLSPSSIVVGCTAIVVGCTAIVVDCTYEHYSLANHVKIIRSPTTVAPSLQKCCERDVK